MYQTTAHFVIDAITAVLQPDGDLLALPLCRQIDVTARLGRLQGVVQQRVGLLINFHEEKLVDGVYRIMNGF